VNFSAKYLAEAVVLLGFAWAVIRWIGRTLLEISGGSRDREGQRFLESTWKPPRPRSTTGAQPSLVRLASGDAAAQTAEDRRYAAQRRPLEISLRELRDQTPLNERTAAMSEAERQAMYDELVRKLDGAGVSDAERAFALAVAIKRLGLKANAEFGLRITGGKPNSERS
jgi:hypothetical protein